MKRFSSYTVAVALALALIVGAEMARAQATLPYSNDFETVGLPLPANLPANWTSVGSGTLTLPPGNNGSAKGLGVEDDKVTLTFDNSVTNAKVHFFAKPALATQVPGDPGPVNGAFYIAADLKLYAWTLNSGTPAWVLQTTLTPPPGWSGWLGFTIHMNYSTATWVLYYTFEPVIGQEMVLATPLPAPAFVTDAAGVGRLQTFAVRAGNPAVIDDVMAGKAYTVPGSSPSSVVLRPGDLHLPGQPGGKAGMGIGTLGRYFTFDDDALNQGLGRLLLSTLNIGDQVRYWDKDERKFYRFPVIDVDPGPGVVLGFDTPNDLPPGGWPSFTPITAMWLDILTGRSLLDVTFAEHTNVPPLGDEPLNVGYTPHMWPFGTRAVTGPTGGPTIETPDFGDSLFVWNSTGGAEGIGEYTWYEWTGTPAQGGVRWKLKSGALTPLTEGIGWWYYNRTGVETWKVSLEAP